MLAAVMSFFFFPIPCYCISARSLGVFCGLLFDSSFVQLSCNRLLGVEASLRFQMESRSYVLIARWSLNEWKIQRSLALSVYLFLHLTRQSVFNHASLIKVVSQNISSNKNSTRKISSDHIEFPIYSNKSIVKSHFEVIRYTEYERDSVKLRPSS